MNCYKHSRAETSIRLEGGKLTAPHMQCVYTDYKDTHIYIYIFMYMHMHERPYTYVHRAREEKRGREKRGKEGGKQSGRDTCYMRS